MKYLILIKKTFQKKSFIISSRLILGMIFIYASWDKIINPVQFADILYNYKILPLSVINLISVFLPWLELITGLFLIFGIFIRTSAKILTTLLIIFIITITINIIRGLDFDCGCFSTIKTDSGSNPYLLLIRDILLLIPGFAIISNDKPKKEKI